MCPCPLLGVWFYPVWSCAELECAVPVSALTHTLVLLYLIDDVALCYTTSGSYNLPASSSIYIPEPWGEESDKISHLGLGAPKSLILCTSSSFESPCQFPSTESRSFSDDESEQKFNQAKNLKVGIETEAMAECCSMVCSPWIAQLALPAPRIRCPSVALFTVSWGALPHQLPFKKMHHTLAHWPICWECFFNWSPLFPNDSCPCEVKPKLASMSFLFLLLYWILQVSWPTSFLGNLYPHLASRCRSWKYRCVPAHWLSLGSREWTQAIRLLGYNLYPLSHLPAHSHFLSHSRFQSTTTIIKSMR